MKALLAATLSMFSTLFILLTELSVYIKIGCDIIICIATVYYIIKKANQFDQHFNKSQNNAKNLNNK